MALIDAGDSAFSFSTSLDLNLNKRIFLKSSVVLILSFASLLRCFWFSVDILDS